jgi:hypothetical protein
MGAVVQVLAGLRPPRGLLAPYYRSGVVDELDCATRPHNCRTTTMSNFSDRDFPPLPSERAKKRRKVTTPSVNRVPGALATINDLPNELLLDILEYFPGVDLEHFQLATLLNLSRVNRRFHELVAERLYATYNSFFCEPYLFLRTVSSNANVASLVHEVDISYGTRAHYERKRYTANAQDKKVVKEGLRALGIPDWKTWATDCNSDRVELEIIHSAVLMHTPNVSSMIVRDNLRTSSDPPKWIDLFRKAHLGTSLKTMHQFKSLQSLRIEVVKLNVASLAPVFRISSLKKLSFEGLVDPELEGNRAEQELQTLRNLIPARCNNIEQLQFERAFIQNDMFAIIVASSQNLKTLDYDLTMENVDPWFEERHAGPTKLATALQSQRASLQSLDLKVEDDENERLPSTYNLRESLHGFTSLRFLRCPLDIVVNCEQASIETLPGRLPCSLEIFHAELRKFTSIKDVDPLAALRSIATEHSSSLHDIHLIIEAEAFEWHGLPWLEEMKQQLSKTNIAFVVNETKPFNFSQWLEPNTSHYEFQSVPDDTVASESSGEVSLYSDDSELERIVNETFTPSN